jgi:hypothetical protein
MKKIFILLFSTLILQTFGEGGQNTQRIYNQLVYEVSSSGWLGKKQSYYTNIVTGSCWVLRGREGSVFITAAHNLAYGPRGTPSQIGSLKLEGSTKLLSTKRSFVIGTLAYKPTEIGMLGPEEDVVLIQVEPGAYSQSRSIKLSKRNIKSGDQVTICGFPGTAHEKLQHSIITAVYPKLIILNDPVDAGFSGGVVLNESGEAVGMITGTEEKQATAVVLTSDMLDQVQWTSLNQVK